LAIRLYRHPGRLHDLGQLAGVVGAQSAGQDAPMSIGFALNRSAGREHLDGNRLLGSG
jgi:hypothetical protein